MIGPDTCRVADPTRWADNARPPAAVIAELSLALSGDEIATENDHQHAEHYFRQMRTT